MAGMACLHKGESMSIDHFSRAVDMVKALAERKISSSELTELHISRIEEHDKKLNAIAVPTFDRAREAAARADDALAKGESGPLLGLPLTLKESTMTAGLPQTAGIEDFKGYIPATDGPMAAKTFEAGGCLLGKTNIPIALGDWQADSPVYGRTNNPWDLTRTPGGSTGGGGAALAAGLTPLEQGSDIGGSIRVPAAYCGAYGHRPTETALPRSGSFPMADLPNDLFILGVQGPLARSAYDLEHYFDVLAGPDLGEDAGWRLDLPVPRCNDLKGARVALLPEIGEVRPSSQMLSRLDELRKFLEAEGATVVDASLPFDIWEYYKDYVRTLMVMMNIATPRAEREAQAEGLRLLNDPEMDPQIDGLTMDACELVMLGTRRASYQAQWRTFFNDIDVIVAPMTLDSAFPHTEGDMMDRSLVIDNETRPYFHNISFPMVAIFTGLPATAFPAGLDHQGLPLGFQAIGPYLEDRTTLRIAQLLEDRWHKFQAPPGY